MLNIESLARAVQDNCDISDAQYAGHYSLCTFLLKMREYYRWEKSIPLSAALVKSDVGNWLSQREQLWEGLTEKPLCALPLPDQSVEPFDTAAANRTLVPAGYVYSGGYGLFHKPNFFLAQLARKETHNGVDVYIAAHEYARELAAPPAMALGETIFVRRESIRRFAWEKIEEWRWKKNENAPLAKAMACYPQSHDIEDTLDRVTDNETHTMVLHELGEVHAGRELGARWEELITAVSSSKAEFLARAVRDHIADCMMTLPTLLADDNRAALHFFFANFSGLRREIFPELHTAYLRWAGGADPSVLRDASERGAQYWLASAHTILQKFAERSDNARAMIESQFVTPTESTVSCAR